MFFHYVAFNLNPYRKKLSNCRVITCYRSILYNFSLLYNVFRSMFSNCAARLLLFPVCRSASSICSFSASSSRSAILGLFDAGVSRISLPSSQDRNETALSQQCGSFDDVLHLPSGCPASDISVMPVKLLASKPISCLSSSLFA